MGYHLHFLSSKCLCDYAIFMRSLTFCLESLMYCSWSCNNKHQVSPLSWAKCSAKEGRFARKSWSSLPFPSALSCCLMSPEGLARGWGVGGVRFWLRVQVEPTYSGHVCEGARILCGSHEDEHPWYEGQGVQWTRWRWPRAHSWSTLTGTRHPGRQETSTRWMGAFFLWQGLLHGDFFFGDN